MLTDEQVLQRHRARSAEIVGGLRVGLEIARAIERIAQKEGRTKNGVVRELIREALDRRGVR